MKRFARFVHDALMSFARRHALKCNGTANVRFADYLEECGSGGVDPGRCLLVLRVLVLLGCMFVQSSDVWAVRQFTVGTKVYRAPDERRFRTAEEACLHSANRNGWLAALNYSRTSSDTCRWGDEIQSWTQTVVQNVVFRDAVQNGNQVVCNFPRDTVADFSGGCGMAPSHSEEHVVMSYPNMVSVLGG